MFSNVSAWQVGLFMILLVITIFRRRLSSNHEYRIHRNTHGGGSGVIEVKRTRLINRLIERVKGALDRLFLRFVPVQEEPFEVFEISRKKSVLNAFEKMSTDNLLTTISFLDLPDIVSLSSTCKELHKELTSDFIWEQLWKQHFGDMWRSPRITQIRKMRGIAWDPMENYGPPQQGWFAFYLEFEYCWSDWILAGACFRDLSLISLFGSILDITDFISEHPGSPETLMDACGFDASELYLDIGHSIQSVAIAVTQAIWNPSNYFQRRRYLKTLEEQFTGRENRFVSSVEIRRTDNEDLFLVVKGKSKFHDLLDREKSFVLKKAIKDNIAAHRILSRRSSFVSAAWHVAKSSIRALVRPLSLATGPLNFGKMLSRHDGGTKAEVFYPVILVPMIPSVSGLEQCYLSCKEYFRNRQTGSFQDFDLEEEDVGEDILESSEDLMASDSDGSDSSSDGSDDEFSPAPASSLKRSATDSRMGISPSVSSIRLSNEEENNSHGRQEIHSFRESVKSFPMHEPVQEFTIGDNCRFFRVCGPCAHNGQPRAFYDPLEQSWIVWWTCCGMGSQVSLSSEDDISAN